MVLFKIQNINHDIYRLMFEWIFTVEIEKSLSFYFTGKPIYIRTISFV